MTALPKITEAEFLNQVLELAELLHWEVAHFRPARTSRGWRTPVQGSLGKGWPDLVLVRERDRRLIFAELKADKGRLTLDQTRVQLALRNVVDEVFVWWPDDWDDIQAALR